MTSNKLLVKLLNINDVKKIHEEIEAHLDWLQEFADDDRIDKAFEKNDSTSC